jgi:hypothetical protein
MWEPDSAPAILAMPHLLLAPVSLSFALFACFGGSDLTCSFQDERLFRIGLTAATHVITVIT